MATATSEKTILVLSDLFPPYNKGGSETVAYNLSHEYLRRGYRVHVITTVQDQLLSGHFLEDGLKVHRLYTRFPDRFRAYWGLYNPALLRRTAQIFRTLDPALVHAHNVHGFLSYHILVQAKGCGAFVLLTLHDAMSFDYGKCTQCIDYSDLSANPQLRYRISPWVTARTYRFRYFPLRNLIIRTYLKRYPNRVVAVSHELKKLVSANGIPCDDVIHNGIDIDRFSIPEDKRKVLVKAFKEKYKILDRKIILFVGRISTLKGLDKLKASLRIVIQQIPNACLLVVGLPPTNNNTYESSLNSVFFTGWLSGSELAVAYMASDVVATPSIYPDPFLMVNLEAMACSKAVISTVFGGPNEIIQNGVTGYLVNPLNVSSFAERIISILKSPEKAKQMGEQGRLRIVKEFSLQKQVDAYLDLFGVKSNIASGKNG